MYPYQLDDAPLSAHVDASLLYQKNLGSVTPVTAPDDKFGIGPAQADDGPPPPNLL